MNTITFIFPSEVNTAKNMQIYTYGYIAFLFPILYRRDTFTFWIINWSVCLQISWYCEKNLNSCLTDSLNKKNSINCILLLNITLLWNSVFKTHETGIIPTEFMYLKRYHLHKNMTKQSLVPVCTLKADEAWFCKLRLLFCSLYITLCCCLVFLSVSFQTFFLAFLQRSCSTQLQLFSRVMRSWLQFTEYFSIHAC